MSNSAGNHRYGAAVIGCGGMGIRHVEAAANHPRIDLVAIVDWEEEVREQCQRDYAVKNAYADYTAILDRDDIQLVVVATWPSTHREIVEACLRADKDVLCEKPLAPSLEEASSMIDTVRETGRKLRVGYVLHYHRAYNKVTEMIREGALGDPPYIMRLLGGEHAATCEHWRRDLKLIVETSPGIDCGCHYVDIMRRVTGADAVWVCGVGARTESDTPSDNFDYELFSVKFDDGSSGIYEVGWTHQYRDFSEKEFVGPAGRIRLTYAHERRDGYREEGDQIEYYQCPGELTVINVPTGFKRVGEELTDLIDAVEQDKDVMDHLDDAYRSLEIVLAGHQAAVEGRTIWLQ